MARRRLAVVGLAMDGTMSEPVVNSDVHPSELAPATAAVLLSRCEPAPNNNLPTFELMKMCED